MVAMADEETHEKTPNEPDKSADKDGASPTFKALAHARELFIYHATQRHQSIRFYIIAVAASLGAAAAVAARAAHQENVYFTGLALSLFIAFATFVFRRLDIRNAELVENNEAGVQALEARIADMIGEDAVKSMEMNAKPRGPSYSTVMPFFFNTIFIFALLAAFGFGAWALIDVCADAMIARFGPTGA